MISTDLDFGYVGTHQKDEFNRLLMREGDDSCEMSFVNLIVWQGVYAFKTAYTDGCILIRSTDEQGEMYRLPICDNFERGMQLLFAVAGTDTPRIWAVEGERLDRFMQLYGDRYDLIEDTDGADYIYLRQELSTLAGKKFQAKRNHISAFSRSYDWRYEPMSEQNLSQIAACARAWYEENADRADEYMLAERDGVEFILSNAEVLGVTGGAIFVGDKAVAFTLGSPINTHTYDIHIEKALAEYSVAYSVINREYAAALPEQYTHLNREDDMGQEGLRRAKLSYRPVRLLKKYYCSPKEI